MAKDLVQPQGVNAGDPDLTAPPDNSPESTRSGGDADAAPDPEQGLIGYPEKKTAEQLTGGPVPSRPGPEEQDGSSGQDAGLIE